MTASLTPSLTSSDLEAVRAVVAPGNERFVRTHPGDSGVRQPVHTVYGGAQLFTRATARRSGEVALATLREYAPDGPALAAALGWTLDPAVVGSVHARVVAKLEREPVEDFRIDFEDGFGVRPDAEEDAECERAAGEVAAAMREASLPPFVGIRIKPFNAELVERSLRTLDLFVTALVRESGGALPDNFRVTLPKVVTPEQVAGLARALDALEQRVGLDRGAIVVELMVETPQSILDDEGRCPLPGMVDAAGGRCVAAHFGTYDYTALCSISAQHQTMAHEACAFAKRTMQVALAQRGVLLSDGATNIMPVGPHRGDDLTDAQRRENRDVVHRAWRISHAHIRQSLVDGFYQGWDLHPSQLPVRYATVFAFFLESLDAAADRLRGFVDKAAKATLTGDVFDDAATGQGLLNFFLTATNCGAITADEAAATGLTREELELRSFAAILARRTAG